MSALRALLAPVVANAVRSRLVRRMPVVGGPARREYRRQTLGGQIATALAGVAVTAVVNRVLRGKKRA